MRFTPVIKWVVFPLENKEFLLLDYGFVTRVLTLKRHLQIDCFQPGFLEQMISPVQVVASERETAFEFALWGI